MSPSSIGAMLSRSGCIGLPEPGQRRLSDAGEAEPMHRRRSVHLDRLPVLAGGVALVLAEPERGIATVQPEHDPVPRHLRDDRGGRHARAHHVALLDPERWARHARHREPVGQGVVRFERARGPTKQGDVRAVQAAPIQHRWLSLGDGERAGLDDPLERCLALLRGEQLRVSDPGGVEPRGDHDARGDERPGKGAPACLVDADDPREALRPQALLVAVHAGVYNHPHLDGGYTITNAFPITVSSGTYPSPVGGENRESPECARLSPSTKSMPSGTATGPKGRVSISGSRYGSSTFSPLTYSCPSLSSTTSPGSPITRLM